MVAKSVVFLVADYGHDPTETAIPYTVFYNAGYAISFATENGNVPGCDTRMLTGWTQKILGADRAAIVAYGAMSKSSSFQTPLSWSQSDFSLTGYDIVFLPGGHDKGVRQILDSHRVHQLLADFFPLTKKPSGKVCAAICHGVQVLAHARGSDGRSVIADVATTALPAAFEDAAYLSTCMVLGDYYKTYGAGTDDVEHVVKQNLASATTQWRSSLNPATPFVVEDQKYNYLSGRWPGDAQLLAEKVLDLASNV